VNVDIQLELEKLKSSRKTKTIQIKTSWQY